MATSSNQIYALEGDVMRLVALGLADGQLEQADRLLCLAREGKRAPKPDGPRPVAAAHYHHAGDPLVGALLHLRSACGWLRSACG